MKIGLFGGTFDPPHHGHLAVAERALTFQELDRVIWVPAAVPPHREAPPTATPADRLEMVRRAIAGSDVFEVSDIELVRPGTSFTVDTLRYLKSRQPDDEVYVIVGGDSLRAFHTWRMPEEILRMARLTVYARSHESFEQVDPHILERTSIIPDAPVIQISSSEIRALLAEGLPVRHLVPDPVVDYIEARHLYAPPPVDRTPEP